MRKTIIAGNWKMNKTSFEAIELANSLKRELADIVDVDIVICPVFTSLSDVNDVILETNIDLGAQNLHWEDSGAFTGEVSAPMIKSIGAKYVIIGHSERRQFFGETDQTVNKKIRAALKHGLVPIVCVGESLAEREDNRTFSVIETQLNGSLAGLSREEIEEIVLAYEPVWAIGTGKTATSAQAQEVHAFIRKWLVQKFQAETASVIRIQYGGSVKADNIAELISQKDIDGALVGGASLQADSFIKIVKNCCGISTKSERTL